MFSVKGKLFPAFFMKKSTISPGIARLRECEIARVRECESARVRDSESARVRDCESARVRECESAKLLVCDFCYCGLSGERVKVLAVFPVLNSLMPIA